MDRLGADARADPRARHLPEPHLPASPTRRSRRWARPSRRWASSSCSPPSSSRPFDSPDVDCHALAPEIVLTGAIVVVLVADLVHAGGLARHRAAARRHRAPRRARPGAHPGRRRRRPGDVRRRLRGRQLRPGAQGAVPASAATSWCCCRRTTSPRATTAEGEYYFLLLSSLLGMTVMASARDLITIFVALELLSIPAYMLAGWRKRDLNGNEAGVKYYLMGVFASAVMLYGMSLLFGASGSTLLTDIGAPIAGCRRLHAVHHPRRRVRGHRLRLQGVGRAVPHLGARHLRGRAHADHRVPRGAVEGGRFVALLQLDLRRLRRPLRRDRAADVGAGRRSR